MRLTSSPLLHSFCIVFFVKPWFRLQKKLTQRALLCHLEGSLPLHPPTAGLKNLGGSPWLAAWALGGGCSSRSFSCQHVAQVVKRQAHGPSFDISILKDTLLIEIDALADALADAIELDT